MSKRLFTIVLTLVLILPNALPVWAQQTASAVVAGKLLEVKVPAPALKGNMLGEPAELNAAIYLPPSYETDASKRYPTVYLLHGFTGNYKAWINGGYQKMNLQTTMDSLIKDGKIREMIVVAPNAWSHYGGAFYTNSVVTGNWEDYIYRDLVQYVDANYRTINSGESRGIAGHSMGGYGALVLGMRHPEVFSAVYAMSPCCTAIEGDMSEANPVWLKVLRLKTKDELKLRPQSFDDFFVIAFVALSTSLSPNPNAAPIQAHFPFKETSPNGAAASLEKHEPTYTRWRSQMPAYMVEEKEPNLRKLRGLFIDYGEKEEFSHIVIGANQFSKALSDRRIPHTLEVYGKGDHGSRIRERIETRVFQFFSERLLFPQ
ncbi:MAG TPA: alpha/beta fold hydrolase [Pyrinomonadaceae bacterium]